MTLDPRPERSRLTPPSREMSDFFFEQRLFDFTTKNLAPYLTDEMKKYMDENMEAKEKVGAMLLAFEYFNAISEIKLEYDKSEFLTYENNWYRKLKANFKTISFIIIFLAIAMALIVNLSEVMAYFGPLLENYF
jgi:hypothetical protein